MTETKTNKLAPMGPGDTFHALATGLTISVTSSNGITRGCVLIRGMSVTLTAESIFENQDRNGQSFLDVIDEPDTQIKRWGAVQVARGPFPVDLDLLIPGSLEHEAESARLRKAAWAIPDENDRAAALKAVNLRFGAFKSGQVSTAYHGGF